MTVRRRSLRALLLAVVSLVGVPLVPAAEAAPTMTAMSPQAGPMSGGTIATITGTELDQITRVWFGAAPGKVVSATPTTLKVRSPASDDADGATVIAGTATGGADGAFNYRYFQMVNSMAPNQGSQLGGTEVQIEGEGLDRVTRVRFQCDGGIATRRSSARRRRRCSPGPRAAGRAARPSPSKHPTSAGAPRRTGSSTSSPRPRSRR